MRVKLFEVCDKATFLPVIAISTESVNVIREYLLRRCGYTSNGKAIILTRLRGGSPASADPYSWNDRTMQVAHNHIEKHFNELEDGDVIDVEFILGETDKPKINERHGDYA